MVGLRGFGVSNTMLSTECTQAQYRTAQSQSRHTASSTRNSHTRTRTRTTVTNEATRQRAQQRAGQAQQRTKKGSSNGKRSKQHSHSTAQPKQQPKQATDLNQATDHPQQDQRAHDDGSTTSDRTPPQAPHTAGKPDNRSNHAAARPNPDTTGVHDTATYRQRGTPPHQRAKQADDTTYHLNRRPTNKHQPPTDHQANLGQRRFSSKCSNGGSGTFCHPPAQLSTPAG